MLTYPRTDARALPEDYQGTVKATLEVLGETNAYGSLARKVLKEKWVRPNKRMFDNSKISDHFAIIPTLQTPRQLNEIEQKLYDFVVKRFLAVFYPAAEFEVTTRITRVDGEPFKTEGKVLVAARLARRLRQGGAGRRRVAGAGHAGRARQDREDRRRRADDAAAAAPQRRRRCCPRWKVRARPIEDDELREAMREKGLGTPATRAQIIEGLIQERYIYREGKDLIPTAKAFSLMTLLHGLGVPELFSPELTAEWEFKLKQMEHGKLKRDAFMREIVAMTQHIVAQAKNYESDTIPGDFATLTVRCPNCGGEVHEQYKKFQCDNCDFGFWKIMGGRQLEPAEADTLIAEREVGPLDGFRSRLGRAFSAKLQAQRRERGRVRLRAASRRRRRAGRLLRADAARASARRTAIACSRRPTAYVCENAVGPDRTCDFRSGRTILQRSIERAQMEKLLANGKTDLLQFVSARTRRPFSAYLARQPDGKVGFEFEAKGEGKGRGRPQRAAALRVLGKHPRDGAPVELHSGRYGPYVKHGTMNATLPDRDKVDSLTLERGARAGRRKVGQADDGAQARAGRAHAARGRTEAGGQAHVAAGRRRGDRACGDAQDDEDRDQAHDRQAAHGRRRGRGGRGAKKPAAVKRAAAKRGARTTGKKT